MSNDALSGWDRLAASFQTPMEPVVEDLRPVATNAQPTESEMIASMCHVIVSATDPALSNLREVLIQVASLIQRREPSEFRELAVKRLVDCWNSLRQTYPEGYDHSPPIQYAVVRVENK